MYIESILTALLSIASTSLARPQSATDASPNPLLARQANLTDLHTPTPFWDAGAYAIRFTGYRPTPGTQLNSFEAAILSLDCQFQLMEELGQGNRKPSSAYPTNQFNCHDHQGDTLRLDRNPSLARRWTYRDIALFIRDFPSANDVLFEGEAYAATFEAWDKTQDPPFTRLMIGQAAYQVGPGNQQGNVTADLGAPPFESA